MTDQIKTSEFSLSYITQLGEQYYLAELREKLEKTKNGEYVVIEPLSKRYYVDEDLLLAIQEAEQEFPDNFFTIIKIGSLQPPPASYKSSMDVFSNAISNS